MTDYSTQLRVPHPDYRDGRAFSGPLIQAESFEQAEEIGREMFGLTVVGEFEGEVDSDLDEIQDPADWWRR